mmetsp:Transcript_3429/g.6813  ORF Transcript_3429/g.6813 Transcript_3429/m.6813 type:complete len:126 (-) Transcript_3429:1692-2069(-)|eukprot:scaffold34603_cov212-Amphora_coffeaeformis.AAC.13
MTVVFESYGPALHAEFVDDTTDSSFDDSDKYVLELAPPSSETYFGDDIELEIAALMEGNDRAELAFMKIPTIFDPQLNQEMPRKHNTAEPQPKRLQNIEKSSAYAVDVVRIGHAERRRSIGNSAA